MTSPRPTDTEGPETTWREGAVVRVFAIFSILVGLGFLLSFAQLWIPSWGQWSQSDGQVPALNLVGDALGPFASLFSGLALIAAFLTLHMQRQELREQRKETRETRREMAEQTKLLKLQGRVAREQARAARLHALRAEAAPIERYLRTLQDTLLRLGDIGDLLEFALAVRDLRVETVPLCENAALSEMLRELHLRFNTAIAEFETTRSIPDVHEGLDKVYDYFATVQVMVTLWYRLGAKGHDVTAEQLEQIAVSS